MSETDVFKSAPGLAGCGSNSHGPREAEGRDLNHPGHQRRETETCAWRILLTVGTGARGLGMPRLLQLQVYQSSSSMKIHHVQ